MDFSVTSDCTSWPGTFGLALAWCIPTLIYAIRHQEAVRPGERRFLGAAQYLFVALATVLSLWKFGLLGNPLFKLVVPFVLMTACVCAAAVGLRRLLGRAGQP
jgi:hypothetical protein